MRLPGGMTDDRRIGGIGSTVTRRIGSIVFHAESDQDALREKGREVDVQGFDANERQLGLMSVIYLLRQPPLGAAALLGVRRAIDVSPEEGPVEIVRHLKAFHRRYDAGQTLS